MIVRLITVLCALLAAHAVVLFTSAGYRPHDIQVPDVKLAELPRQFRTDTSVWTGTEVELDERLVQAIGAHDVVSREYRNADGLAVSVHCSVITDVVNGVDHLPDVCYEAAAWRIVNRETKSIDSSPSPATARKMTVERDSAREYVYYWYRMGDQSFVSRDSFRPVRRRYFGQETWPAAVKVMLQISAQNGKEAEAAMVGLGKQIDQWIQQHNGVVQ